MSEFSDFEYASAALRRVQARAQAQGHYRIPLRSRRRSVSGQSEEFAEEIFSIIADNDSILIVAVSESAAQKVTAEINNW